MLNFFTEVEALAWSAEIAKLPNPQFISAPGSPDILAGDNWIEAKTINKSADRREYEERVIRPALEAGRIVMSEALSLAPPLPGLVAKFQADLDDGIRKWERQGRAGHLIMFYDWVNVDLGTSKRDAERAVSNWAGRQERATGIRIVIAWNYSWLTPWYPQLAES